MGEFCSLAKRHCPRKDEHSDQRGCLCRWSRHNGHGCRITSDGHVRKSPGCFQVVYFNVSHVEQPQKPFIISKHDNQSKMQMTLLILAGCP